MKDETKAITASRSPAVTQKMVNPPVFKTSTVVFESVSDMNHAIANQRNHVPFYGRRGTPTSFAFCEAMTELEEGAGTAVYPSGSAAIAHSILSFSKTGDHILVVDNVYEPTRDVCDKFFSGLGISTTYFDPLDLEKFESLIRPETKVVFLESPGSITMEIMDIPALCEIAHKHDIVVMCDNTWASPVLFKPLNYGVDVSIHSATKYIAGHSDIMMGIATSVEKHWPVLRENSYLMGQCTSPDDLYQALKGIRTLPTRIRQHEKNALEVAQWLIERPEVARMIHPAFDSCPGHEVWKRDFDGSNGLFSFTLAYGNTAAVHAFVDNLKHFKLGYSWGGFESLIMFYTNLDKKRHTQHIANDLPLIRLHIGLEHPSDLIADLERAFLIFNENV